MKTKKPLMLATLILSLVSLIATAYIYPRLPLEIPIHFNAAGEIDNYGHRSMAFVTAALPLLMLGLFVLLPKFDPKKYSYKQHSKAYSIFLFAIIFFFLIIHWATIAITFGISISISKIVPVLTGILFIILGNYMPQIRQNYTFGIRLPWALDNSDNWRYTHRIGGYCFVFGGILLCIGIFFSTTIQIILFILAILEILLIPTIASYLFFKKTG